MDTPSNPSMEDDDARCSYFSLVSRLDQLGFIMKYLERNQNLGVRSDRACLPLDLAAKEASIKGSLLDRVTSLEHRLFQLCLEMESTSLRTLLTTCDQNGSSTQVCSSFPIFRYPNEARNQEFTLQPNQVQGKSQKGEEKMKKNSSSGNPAQPRKIKRGEKPKKKETNEGTWPRLKMLGC